MPSLAVIVEDFEARRAARIAQEAATGALTPLGRATVALIRLRRALADIDAADRVAIAVLMHDVIGEIANPPATA